ncbi:MAG: hypothetical protein ABI887_06080 [Burkholderiales bacterium]
MSATAEAILADLRAVDDERAVRATRPGLAQKVAALKKFQQRRFSNTYADLLASARYAAAARFFLEELYGPEDFTRRDSEFARVVPALVRLFPSEVVHTVATLARLHALSETLDTAMADHLDNAVIDPDAYIGAWQAIDHSADRDAQISLTLDVAARLDHFTRKPLLRGSLRLMRGPARAAGLAELQQFLENGFDTFRAMRGAEEFIRIVELRERALASALFSEVPSCRQAALAALPVATTVSRVAAR